MPMTKVANETIETQPGRRSGRSSLAQDGLPWPKGYFDRAPRQSLEEAIAIHGVRPSEYYKGWPCYTPEEASRPEYKSKLPDEPLELQAQWRKESEAWAAAHAHES